MQAALADHVLKGDFVYHSWAGHLLLKGVPAMLEVRTVAPTPSLSRRGWSGKS
jgi:hypothetical protein